MCNLRLGVAFWSFGRAPDMDAPERSHETAADIGVKGAQSLNVGDVPDPDRLTGGETRTEVVARCNLRIMGRQQPAGDSRSSDSGLLIT